MRTLTTSRSLLSHSRKPFLRTSPSRFLHTPSRPPLSPLLSALPLPPSPQCIARSPASRFLHTPSRPPLSPLLASLRSPSLLLPPSPYKFSHKRYFRVSTPLRGIHVFRLVHFVAPIVMKQVKTWVGTPSTNAHFKRRLAITIALILGLPLIYIISHLETTPYTDRLRFVALTSDDELKLGELTFSQLVEEHETNFIPDHHHYVSHVTEVALRIIEATERPDIKWEIRLIDSPVTNAFAIPGGKIFVFSGLLDVTQNDDGLAFILGHEVAHVLARHGAEQMAVGKVMLGVSVLVSAIFGDNIGSFILGRLLSWLTELSYSRNMEREADYIGLVLMRNARYNIDEAPKVWQRMMAADPSEPNTYLSTHPSHTERIADITKWIEELKTGKAHQPIAIAAK